MRKCFVIAALSASTPALASPQQEIAAVMQQSAQDWTRGDLGAFMRCYENSPQTEYIAASGPVRGYAAIEARYHQKYGAPGQNFGVLSFSDLDTRVLDPDYALTTGRFLLRRPAKDGSDATGIFTLILHHGAAGWRIQYDHTS